MNAPAAGRRACVIGWPVAHSRSPVIHGHWLKHYGIEGSYGREAVAPEDFAGFLGRLSSLGYIGCNVTLPHKEAAYGLVEVQDQTTKRIGAVNTVYVEGDRQIGFNSDAYGFIAHLRSVLPDWRGQGANVLVLGAGGAARAIVAGLLGEGVKHIAIANRTEARGRFLARHFGADVSALAWPSIPRHLPACDLLVNTTLLGMAGQPALDIDLDGLPVGAAVADIVYVPLETDLLRQARARGNPVVDGLGMLLHQAVPGFEVWFGVRPEVTQQLRAAVEADLAGQ
jgi:shikimate dehydrogenase